MWNRALCLEGRRSFQLSYGRVAVMLNTKANRPELERFAGVSRSYWIVLGVPPSGTLRAVHADLTRLARDSSIIRCASPPDSPGAPGSCSEGKRSQAMRYNTALILSSALLCFSVAARSQQASTAAAESQPQSGNQAFAASAGDCDSVPRTAHTAAKVEISAPETPTAQSGLVGAIPALDETSAGAARQHDLEFLTRKQSALAQCILEMPASAEATDLQGACSGELLLNFVMRHDGEPERDVPIGRLAGTSAFFYESGMTIDADGAPNAYHPDNTGLDDLANAGAPGRWEGLAKRSLRGTRTFRGPTIRSLATMFPRRRWPITPNR